jgi:cell division protein FtsL
MARAGAGAAVAPRVAPKRAASTTSAGARAQRRSAGRAGTRPSVHRRASGRVASAAAPRALDSAVALPLPVRVLNAPFARVLRERGERTLDALLAGRGWIVLVGVLLAGIVFFNVDLLKLNRDIAATAEQIEQLKRENGRYRERVAAAASSERIQEEAVMQGLVLPQPGAVRYLEAHPGADPALAVKRYTEPTTIVAAPAPAVVTPPPTTVSTPVEGSTTAVAPTTTTPTTTTPEPVTPPSTATTAPAATTTPDPATTTTPPAGTSSGTAVAPTG